MIPFSKYEGTGNDFILIDDRTSLFDVSCVKSLCHRKFGVGADGVILLQKPQSTADFRMRIFNSDGSEAESCGNGIRCLARFIADLGLEHSKITLEVHDRLVKAFYIEGDIGVEMGEPRDLCLNLPLHVKGETVTVHSIDTGVPHLIRFVRDAAAVNLDIEAPQLRRHPALGPRGANVNFASLMADGAIAVRTFERGVEGETLACGTGAVAVSVAAAHLFDLPSPITTRFAGGELRVSFEDKGLKNLCLIGPAKKVFSGFL